MYMEGEVNSLNIVLSLLMILMNLKIV